MTRPRETPRRLVGLAWLPLLAALGCGRSCKNDHPYVPYAVGDSPNGSGAEAPPSDADTATSELDSGAQAGTVAPPNTGAWTLDGLALTAPADRVFSLGLVRDFDGDGVKDVLAVVNRPAANGPGEVVLYRGRLQGLDAPETIATPPPMAADASCSPTQRLAQVGRRSAWVELGTVCAGHGGAAERWIAVLLIDKPTRTHVSATLLDPPGAPKLTIEADGSDRDGDGIDDVTLQIAVEGGGAPFEPGPRLGAKLRWFDRSAGMSRDPGEPEASFRALAQVASARATRAKDAATVPGYVRQLRMLHRAMCREGGTPRVTLATGAVGCGTSRALEDAGLAEARAQVTQGDALRAIVALDRAELPPAARTPSRTAEAAGWIARVAPTVNALSPLRAVAAVPDSTSPDRGPVPSWGPLAFESSGKLLVRTSNQIVRVDPVAGDEAEASDVIAWKGPVVSPDGTLRFVEAYDACDGVVHATFEAGADSRDVPLPVSPPTRRCTGGRGEPVPAVPIAWGPRGLEALVGGEPVLISPEVPRGVPLARFLGQPTQPGAPRSPNGAAMVVPTAQGILVLGAKTRLYRAREIEKYSELRDCAVSDDSSRVACVRAGRALVGVWDAP